MQGSELLRDLMVPVLPLGRDDPQRVARVTGERSRLALVLIEQSMTQLRSLTRSLPSSSVVLDIQRRGDRGSVTLRWRTVNGDWVADSTLPSIVAGYPESLRSWYMSAHVQVLWLNAAERTCRRVAADYEGLALAIGQCQCERHPSSELRQTESGRVGHA